MKHYPSINSASKAPREPCIGFVKYDGTNFRAEWSRKRGWYKFGVRNRLIDENEDIYGPSIPLFLNKYSDELVKVFKAHKKIKTCQSVIVYGEFFGTKSFAGSHMPCEDWDVVLFDVNPHKQGFISPREFVDEFGHLNVAEVIYQGDLTDQFIENVRNSDLDFESKYKVKTEVPEGVIVKGGSGHRLWMAKVKSLAYKEALKKRYEADWIKFWE